MNSTQSTELEARLILELESATLETQSAFCLCSAEVALQAIVFFTEISGCGVGIDPSVAVDDGWAWLESGDLRGRAWALDTASLKGPDLDFYYDRGGDFGLDGCACLFYSHAFCTAQDITALRSTSGSVLEIVVCAQRMTSDFQIAFGDIDQDLEPEEISQRELLRQLDLLACMQSGKVPLAALRTSMTEFGVQQFAELRRYFRQMGTGLLILPEDVRGIPILHGIELGRYPVLGRK